MNISNCIHRAPEQEGIATCRIDFLPCPFAACEDMDRCGAAEKYPGVS